MYLGPRPQRRPLRLTILLLLLILLATIGTYYIAEHQPEWAKPFEPTPTPTRSADSYTAEAEAYYREGQLDEAIASYQKVIAITPDDATAHIQLARFLILRERTAEALYYAIQAVQLAPSNAQALAILCRALDWEGQYAEAFDACECAIELAPDSAEAHAYLAEVYADTGSWGAARNYGEKAVELDFQSVDAHRNLGYVYEMQGRFRQAAESYENAIFLHPKLATLYSSAGRNYRALGQFEQAEDRFQRVTRLDPANPQGFDQLGWTYYTAGDYDRAIDNLEQATLVDPDYAAAWGHLGIVNYVMQQYEEAIVTFQRAINLAEEDYLRQTARSIVIVGQDATYDPPRAVDVMQGEFQPLYRRGVTTLETDIDPILPVRRLPSDIGQGCGDLIAAEYSSQTDADEVQATQEPEPETTSEPENAFLNASGKASLDLEERRIKIEMSDVPQPIGLPYEARVDLWPDETISLGFFQPDADGNASIDFTFEDVHPAPVEYYYSLGFSYIHLDNQCDKGVPWLLISLDIDPGPTNPAWQGLNDCPGY